MIKACSCKRLLSLLVSLCMMLSLLNVSALAVEGEEPEQVEDGAPAVTACEEHSWGSWTVTQSPTTEAEGEETRTCKVCGAVETQAIPALEPVHEHEWDESTVTAEPRCEEAGERTFTCTVEGCGETRTEEIAATGHEWEAEPVEGGIQYTCALCGESHFLPDDDNSFGTNVLTDEPVTTAEALAAAVAAGGTVTLGGNIVMDTADIVTVPEGVTVTLDMAGHEIMVDESFAGRPIVNNGTLTVTGEGKINSSASANGGYGAINNKGTLTIENGYFSGAKYAGGSVIRNTGASARWCRQ